jgi:hypothetical protein
VVAEVCGELGGDIHFIDVSAVGQTTRVYLSSHPMVCAVEKLDQNIIDTLHFPDSNSGRMFSLNLSYAFNVATFNETTTLLRPLSKTGGTASNNIAPNYVDGALFANDGEFYLYG